MARERDSRRKRDMEEFLMGSRMSMRALFGYLMKAVILLDVRTRGKQDQGESILSMESKSLLRTFAKKWRLSEPSQILSYIELLFQYYQQDKLSLVHVLQAYDYMRERQKEPHWFNELEVRRQHSFLMSIQLTEMVRRSVYRLS